MRVTIHNHVPTGEINYGWLGEVYTKASVPENTYKAMFRGYFADPDPGFKSPDLSISKHMGSKWWFW